jgi:putative glutathione S-transferase
MALAYVTSTAGIDWNRVDYHGHQAGRGIVEALKEQVKGCTVALYTHSQTVAFYEKLGFRRQKTGMVILNKGEEEARWMEGEGFLLAQGPSFRGKLPQREGGIMTETETASNAGISELTKEVGEGGRFVRQKNRFMTPFGDGPGELSVEAGRYRLLWTPICPWAHRSVIVRKVLGLESVISLGTAFPVRTEQGWEFSLDPDGVDPVLKIRFLPEIYKATDPSYEGRATVPTVADVKKHIVVNNDYFRLTNYFETAWRPFHRPGAPELYPEDMRREIDELNQVLFDEVNNAVYKCGFARSQAAYEESFDLLFGRLDYLEHRLAKQRYLFGDFITDSDVRLYVTLARFDAAYYGAFRTNLRRIVDYPNLWGYARDLYQTYGFGDTTNFDAIKRGYYSVDSSKNQFGIVPKGPDASLWLSPHGREKLGGCPFSAPDKRGD